MTQQTRHFGLGGGLDLVTPGIVKNPGGLIGAVNYEATNNGYRRIDGFERFDGRPKPSEAQYWVLGFDAGTTEPTVGQTITGGTSGATGILIVAPIVESGDWGANDAAGTLVLTQVTGTFQDDEALTGVATANGAASIEGATNDADNQTYLQAAIEYARDQISAVPGSGPIRGVWVYKGDTYAIRDNVSATAGVLHKATASGWAAQDLGRFIAFDAGTTEFVEGETLTGGTSGATATIARVARRQGAWDGTAIGILVLTGVTGTFQNNEALTSASGAATANGADFANALEPGGRYHFVNHNFFGASNLERMYAAGGVGRAFEWDGSVFVPIVTGMETDEPIFVAVNHNHLFLAFPGGSAQHSGIGDPYAWSPVLGAAEIGIGEEITGFVQDYAGILVILGRNKIAILYGNDASNWRLDPFAEDAGAVAWTAEKIGTPIFLDDRGLRSLPTSDAYGDFRMGTLTERVEPLLKAKQRNGIEPVAATRVRAKDQYRLFWDDGTGISVYLGRREPEIITFNLGLEVTSICSSENVSGDEVLFFASDNGFVYQLDAGTSFDGEDIEAFIRMPFNHVGSPTYDKRWHKVTLETDATAAVTLGLIAEFSYADPDTPPSQELDFSLQGGGGFWDDALWNEFFWSSPVSGLAESNLNGIGTNVSVGVLSKTATEQPHTIHGLILHYTMRRLRR